MAQMIDDIAPWATLGAAFIDPSSSLAHARLLVLMKSLPGLHLTLDNPPEPGATAIYRNGPSTAPSGRVPFPQNSRECPVSPSPHSCRFKTQIS
jgi:hypothetical protein